MKSDMRTPRASHQVQTDGEGEAGFGYFDPCHKPEIQKRLPPTGDITKTTLGLTKEDFFREAGATGLASDSDQGFPNYWRALPGYYNRINAQAAIAQWGTGSGRKEGRKKWPRRQT